MNSAFINGKQVWILGARLALPLLLLGTLACGGNGGLPAASSTPPSPPVISVPSTGTTGFPVTATIQGGSSSLTYNWIISGVATFSGGVTTANGRSVTFNTTVTGTVTLTCTALAGNALQSQPSTAQVTVNPPSTALGSFQPAGNLLQGRQGLAAAALVSGSILVTGGAATPGGPGLTSTELFNPITQSSSAGPALNTARTGHALALLPGGTQFLVTGGTGAGGSAASPASEIYDSGLNVFSPSAAMATGRTRHSATPLISPAGVLIAGGVTAAGTPMNTAELYNAGVQTFSSAGSVALAPGHTATTLPNGKVLLVSHTVSGTASATAEVFDPVAGSFTPTANLGTPRLGPTTFRLSYGKILVLGGTNAAQGCVAAVEAF
jgi:hypothetical protein